MIRTHAWLSKNFHRLGVLEENINPASVDVCLGSHIIEYTYDEQYEKVDEVEYRILPGEPFTFVPGKFYLCHTDEYTYIPKDHCAQLILKSSSGRKGLDHAHSGWGDPGFEGQWTFEFVAHKPVTFTCGQRIAQLVFMRCDEETVMHYGVTGRYNGQTDAQVALEDGSYARVNA